MKTSKGFKYLLMCFFTIAVWSVFVFGVAFYGWWMEDAAESGSYEKFFSWAANEIDTKNNGTAALVLIEDGEIVSQYSSSPWGCVNTPNYSDSVYYSV